MGRNKVLGKLGRLTGHGNETTAVVGGTLSIRISTSARSASVSFLSLSLFSRLAIILFSAISIYTIRVWPTMQPVLFHVPASPLGFPRHPSLLLLPSSSLYPTTAEHRYHDRISPSKFPLVRAGSQSNNHLRALHSYLTRRGSRANLSLYLCPSQIFSSRLRSSSTSSLFLSLRSIPFASLWTRWWMIMGLARPCKRT